MCSTNSRAPVLISNVSGKVMKLSVGAMASGGFGIWMLSMFTLGKSVLLQDPETVAKIGVLLGMMELGDGSDMVFIW